MKALLLAAALSVRSNTVAMISFAAASPSLFSEIIASLSPATLNHVAVVSCVFFCKDTDGDSGLFGGPIEFGQQNIFFFDDSDTKGAVMHVRTAPAPLEAPSK
jgi:hypothetical protein